MLVNVDAICDTLNEIHRSGAYLSMDEFGAAGSFPWIMGKAGMFGLIFIRW